MSSAERQYRNLDVLRAIAVSDVFVYHAMLMSHPGEWLVRIMDGLGRFGVILFFFHTSFVLMQSLESLDPDSSRWALRFYVRRMFRIYPLAIVVVVGALVLSAPFAPWYPGWVPVLNIRSTVANLMLVQNLTGDASVIIPLWSLPIEVQMYAMLPLIFVAVRRTRWKGMMIFMWMLAAALAVVIYLLTHRLNLFAFIPCFLSGALAYKLTRSKVPIWSSHTWIPAILVITIGGLLGTLKVPAEWLLCLALGLLFTNIRDMKSSWVTKSSHLVAKYSFGIYLFHLFAFWTSFDLLTGLRSTTFRLGTALAITGAASFIGFHLIEDPLIRAGKAIAGRLRVA
jgi:peptidoglycan/LPS O-acetylase OafA/YrhL